MKIDRRLEKLNIALLGVSIFLLYFSSEGLDLFNTKRMNVLGANVVSDSASPEVKLEPFVVYENVDKIRVQSNEPLIESSEYYNLSNASVFEGAFVYDLNFTSLPSYPVFNLEFTDLGGNPAQALFVNQPHKASFEKIKGENCSAGSLVDNALTAVLDKELCLTEDFETDFEFRSFKMDAKTVTVNRIIYDDLVKLLRDAEKEKIDLIINSAYRSFNDQNDLRDDFIAWYGEEEADQLSAIPGHSEHQLGTAVDFSSAEVYSGVRFEDSQAYNWLIKNAYRYGFVLSYPKGQQTRTGYTFEPWHWRYIGPEHAEQFEILKEDLTLSEFLILVNKAREI